MPTFLQKVATITSPYRKNLYSPYNDSRINKQNERNADKHLTIAGRRQHSQECETYTGSEFSASLS